ncbi:hypothetical protein [Haloglomus halophilum]|uniref:hypothetical protein n=1 Tax=Haloglomus halophilum TaxID=2962672 RepID=UPI0020C988D3|nr:hypothetical protein [Haloglomus halophilum]
MPSPSQPATDSLQSHRPPSDSSGEPTIAVAHYPEGAGHATRMLAIADELETRGATVRMAGGGAGSRFVALNGYDAFEPTNVDFIDTVQDGAVRQVLTGSLPASANRIADYVDWLRETAPDALVTDDMFAAMAALRIDVPLYVLKHDMPGLYRNRLERAGAAFHTSFQVSAAEAFFYPAVWPAAGLAPEGATRVPPVALEGESRDRDGADVVVVPSHYSELGRIATALEREGYDVIDVGSDDWEPVPSLLPYLRDAEVVVCSGYSTVMDAAVAGTPCVVHPATDEQEAVADRLRDDETAGFTVAEEPLDVLEAVADPPDPTGHENGAPYVAETILADLRTTTAPRTDGRIEERAAADDRRPVAAGRGVGRRAATGRDRLLRVGDRVRGGARSAGRAGVRGATRTAVATRRTAVAVAAGARSTAGSVRRYGLATSVLLASVAVFADCRLRRTGDATARRLAALAAGLRTVAARTRDALARGERALARAGTTVAGGIARLGGSLRDALATGTRE